MSKKEKKIDEYTIIYYGEDNRRVATAHWLNPPSSEELESLIESKEKETTKNIKRIKVVKLTTIYDHVKKDNDDTSNN